MDKEDTLDAKMNRIDEMLINTEAGLIEIVKKLEARNKVRTDRKVKPVIQKKNYPLHIMVEKDLIEKLKFDAKENNVSMGEWCRQKLRGCEQLDRIERKIDKLGSDTINY